MEKTRHDSAVNGQFRLRGAVSEDAIFVARLENDCMSFYAKAYWPDWIDSVTQYGFAIERHRIIVADDMDVGCVDLWANEDHNYLSKLYLIPELRGRGIGSELLLFLQRESAARGVPLRISVLKNNSRAKEFYLRNGAKIVETKIEALVMEMA